MSIIGILYTFGRVCGFTVQTQCIYHVPGGSVLQKKVVEFDTMYGDVGSHNNLLYQHIVFTSVQFSCPIWYSACWFVVDIIL